MHLFYDLAELYPGTIPYFEIVDDLSLWCVSGSDILEINLYDKTTSKLTRIDPSQLFKGRSIYQLFPLDNGMVQINAYPHFINAKRSGAAWAFHRNSKLSDFGSDCIPST